MAIVGDDGVVIRENQINRNVPSQKADISGGVVVLSSVPFGGNDENGNQVVENTILRNRPKDVIWDGNGTGNTFKENHCRQVHPAVHLQLAPAGNGRRGAGVRGGPASCRPAPRLQVRRVKERERTRRLAPSRHSAVRALRPVLLRDARTIKRRRLRMQVERGLSGKKE